jgi:hypothetical protein
MICGRVLYIQEFCKKKDPPCHAPSGGFSNLEQTDIEGFSHLAVSSFEVNQTQIIQLWFLQ